MKVYDMLGKLLGVHDAEVAGISAMRIGAGYPAGVYQVVVCQGEKVQTLRVIKR